MAKKVSAEERARLALVQQLKEARFCKDVTLEELGKVCGVSQQWMGILMKNPEKMTLQQWRAVNNVLHLDPAPFNTAAGFLRGGFLGINSGNGG